MKGGAHRTFLGVKLMDWHRLRHVNVLCLVLGLDAGNVVAQWLVRRTDLKDLKVESSSPDRCTHVVFLGKTLHSHTHSASIHTGV